MSFRPTITEMDDHRRAEWIGRVVLPGVFDGRHSFQLEGLPDNRTGLTQSEEVSGILVLWPDPSSSEPAEGSPR
jgi:hypothetical protein